MALSAVLLMTSSAQSQTASLSLRSGSASRGGSVALNLGLSASGAGPGSLQWTLSYPTSDVVSLSTTVGAALTAAGKSLNCSPKSGSVTCVASGINGNGIANGVVAVVTVTLSPTSSSLVSLPVTNVMGALPMVTLRLLQALGAWLRWAQPLSLHCSAHQRR